MARNKIPLQNKLVFGGVAAMIVFAIIYFLGQSDPGGITGGAALALQSGGFWAWVIAGAAIGGFSIYKGIQEEKKVGKVSRAKLFIYGGIVLMFVVWIPACNKKAETKAPVQIEAAK